MFRLDRRLLGRIGKVGKVYSGLEELKILLIDTCTPPPKLPLVNIDPQILKVD